MSEWILLGIGLLLTIGTGLFVASEFALVNLDRADLEARRERGETRLGMTIAALKITSTHLSSAQLGITLTTLLTGYTMEPAISSLLAGPLAAIGVPASLVRPVGATTAIIVATLLSMIIGELVPKNFALALPLATAKLVIPFQTAFTWVFRPAISLLNGSANAILRAVGIEPKEELSGARSAEELSSLVRRSASAGLLEKDTATLLGRTLRFSDHDASDVMTPRPRVAAVQRLEPAEAVLELARQTGLSRFPVYDENLDDVVGVVHVKQAVAVPRERRAEVPASALQSDALRVPETIKLDALLGELRGRGFQMAVVVDEYGGTAGVATLEDLVEELVGEVADEHDRTRAGIVRRGDNVSFPGILRPDELVERTGIRVPENGDYETVAGYVMAELGRLPAVGDEVAIDGGMLRVQRLDGRRIDRLRFVPRPMPADEAADDEEAGR
ncbi:hemolysin family protein [Agromyces lapidis]|uniref:Hemolysin family protein n=1 Tax=Agromyces lapidis TaxID=279574 RepID=A0ABV5SR34_9MICO|nr:hemolysin family protein [Agromyces lapidis]